jgi:hypothetical protein
MPRFINKTVILLAILFLPCQHVVSGQLESAFLAYKQGDSELAQREWLALAIKGDVRAQFFLSVFFDEQSNSPKDRDNAKRWLTASANNGFVPAQFNIGNNFHKGRYGQIDNKKAEYWWNQAAMQGFPEAQYRLAYLYYRGKHGVERNLKEAYYWYEQAAKGGHEQAVDALLLMRAGEALPPEQAGAPSNIAYDDPRIVSKLSLPTKAIAQTEQQNLPSATKPQQAKVDAPESVVADKQEKPASSLTNDIKLPAEVVSEIQAADRKQQKQDWVSQQPPANYTIQLLASTIPQECKKYSSSLTARDKLETYTQSFMQKGKRYCAVVYGSYGSYSQAKSSLSLLPRKIRKRKPWIRKIAR